MDVSLGLKVIDEAFGQARDLPKDVFEFQRSEVPALSFPFREHRVRSYKFQTIQERTSMA